MTNQNPPCLTHHDGWICTADQGHTGAHIAHDVDLVTVLHEWQRESVDA